MAPECPAHCAMTRQELMAGEEKAGLAVTFHEDIQARGDS